MRNLTRCLFLFIAFTLVANAGGCRKPRKQVLTKKQIQDSLGVAAAIIQQADSSGPSASTGPASQ